MERLLSLRTKEKRPSFLGWSIKRERTRRGVPCGYLEGTLLNNGNWQDSDNLAGVAHRANEQFWPYEQKSRPKAAKKSETETFLLQEGKFRGREG
jgi:hypothetical protein